MRKLIASIQMSLDGFISGPNGEMDWLLTGDEEWEDLLHYIGSVDTMMVGRNMSPEYFDYWNRIAHDPEIEGYSKQYALLAMETPHIVVSKSLSALEWKNTTLMSDLKTETETLKQQEGHDILAWGGATLLSELANSGLIDELRIEIAPVILGGGLSLFEKFNARIKLELIHSRQLKSGGMIIAYKLG